MSYFSPAIVPSSPTEEKSNDETADAHNVTETEEGESDGANSSDSASDDNENDEDTDETTVHGPNRFEY